MHINIVFIVLTFVMIIIIILLSDSLTSAMLIISILANFLIITSQFSKHANISGGNTDAPNANNDAPNANDTNITTDAPNDIYEAPETSLYGKDYDKHRAYQESYSLCYDEPKPRAFDSCVYPYNIDSMNAIMAQRRARDKRSMDGAVVKSADYYKLNFDDELDEFENKPWWGRNEF